METTDSNISDENYNKEASVNLKANAALCMKVNKNVNANSIPILNVKMSTNVNVSKSLKVAKPSQPKPRCKPLSKISNRINDCSQFIASRNEKRIKNYGRWKVRTKAEESRTYWGNFAKHPVTFANSLAKLVSQTRRKLNVEFQKRIAWMMLDPIVSEDG